MNAQVINKIGPSEKKLFSVILKFSEGTMAFISIWLMCKCFWTYFLCLCTISKEREWNENLMTVEKLKAWLVAECPSLVQPYLLDIDCLLSHHGHCQWHFKASIICKSCENLKKYIIKIYIMLYHLILTLIE